MPAGRAAAPVKEADDDGTGGWLDGPAAAEDILAREDAEER